MGRVPLRATLAFDFPDCRPGRFSGGLAHAWQPSTVTRFWIEDEEVKTHGGSTPNSFSTMDLA